MTTQVLATTCSPPLVDSRDIALKRTIEDLALFGGEAAFARTLHVGRPNIGDREGLFRRIAEVLDRRWLTNRGPLVQEFEERVAEVAGVSHCVAMCNATVALGVAARALDLEGEVILPACTFVATAHALAWQGLTPVFCDVREDDLTIDPLSVEHCITPRTTAILGVHLFGNPCDIEALEEIAARRSLKLLFDAAHAFGCSRGGKRVGAFGHAEVFSFHATKVVNSFEGGAVVTNDAALAERVRRLQNFGFDGYDSVSEVGTNGKMHEVSAAMGLASLDRLEEIFTVNREHYRTYERCLVDIPGVRLRPILGPDRRNFHNVVIEVDPSLAGLTRDDLVAVLHAENVLARRYFFPGCHRMKPYVAGAGHCPQPLPVTDVVLARIASLPTGSDLTSQDVEVVSRLIQYAVANGPEIRARMTRAN